MTSHVCGCHPRAISGGSGATTGAPSVKGYSPPPPPVSPVKGLIDFHTHAAPDVMGRAVDDDELASLAATREMEAIVHVAGIKIFGGIVLNKAVGGINRRPSSGCGGCRAIMAGSCGSRRSTRTTT